MVSCQVTSHIPQLSRQLNLLILYTGALQIENSEESDQGKYECVAMNSAGTRYSSPANLYVRGNVKYMQIIFMSVSVAFDISVFISHSHFFVIGSGGHVSIYFCFSLLSLCSPVHPQVIPSQSLQMFQPLLWDLWCCQLFFFFLRARSHRTLNGPFLFNPPVWANQWKICLPPLAKKYLQPKSSLINPANKQLAEYMRLAVY